jgi:hypothetical protein
MVGFGSGRVGSGFRGIVAIGSIDINGLEVITRARIYHEPKKKRPEGRSLVIPNPFHPHTR